ncbi:MAG: serine/threonine-protein kinase, partial [Thermoanaerobaculia bacterium]
MSELNCPSHVNVTACACPPPSSGERSAFLAERLALFGKVGTGISLSFYILINSLFSAHQTEGPFHWVTSRSNRIGLGILAACGLLWLVARRGRLGERALLILDAAAVIAISTLCALNGWFGGRSDVARFNGLLACSHLLVARSILVPSLAWRSSGVSTLGMLPVALPAFLAWLRPEAGADPRFLEQQLGLFACWSFIAVVVSAVVSSVIYGLRCEVRQAQRFGQYKLEEKIGEGGMGEVYRASHALLRRPTAIKLLRPERAGEENIRRFEREVQLSSLLTHPNTVAIYDYGHTPEGTFYYAMEYLPGLNLDALVRQSGPQPPGRVIHILKQVCASLAEAHGAGLIHRDIKAANIILCERGGLQDVAKV